MSLVLINRFAPANTAGRGNRIRKSSGLLGIYQTQFEATDDYRAHVCICCVRPGVQSCEGE